MIVAPQPAAVEAGAEVLASGGNAFDAAVACALVQGVVDPHACGLGGYLVMTAHKSGDVRPATILDAPATAGSRVTPEMWQDVVLRPNPRGWGYFLKDRISEDGYLSVCTPGMVRGLEAIHTRFCTRPWADLFAPAIRTAHEGWMITATPATAWKSPPQYYEGSSPRQKLNVTPDAQRIYLKPDGSTYDMGETLRNPDYARTLERLAKYGPDEFYTGELATEISADLHRHGSWVTADDLADYTIREDPPVAATYRGYRVVSTQSPHGGPTLAAILNILEGNEPSQFEHNSPDYIEHISLAMKAAFADRNRYLADPQFEDVPWEWMTSKSRAEEWRKHIAAGKPIDTGRVQQDSPSTTHVSVVDSEGNCVSLTHSLGTSSGVITPGLGFMYNNSMVNFHPWPGHPNSIAPRKGRTTGMTPTIVFEGDRPLLVLGAPGATRILTAVLQVILNVLEFRMSVSDAVLAPRFDCQGDTIYCQSRIPELVCRRVRRHHPIERAPQSHGGFALVNAIHIDEHTGELSGAADTGSDGMALKV